MKFASLTSGAHLADGHNCPRKRDTDLSGGRTDVEDRSGCHLPSQACTQQRSKDLRHRKWGCQVYFELTAILLQRQMKKWTGNCHTGIVDQSGQLETAKLCAHFSCSPLYGLSVRYIHDHRSEGLSEFTLNPIGLTLLAHPTKSREPFPVKALRNAPSDSR